MGKNYILMWKCPTCGKVIKSIYPIQFESNKHFHRISHKLKGDKMETQEKKEIEKKIFEIKAEGKKDDKHGKRNRKKN